MAAGLEDIIKADYIRLDIGVGVRYRIAHPRLRREVDNYLRRVFAEHFAHFVLIREVRFDKNKISMLLKLFEPRFFQADIIVVVDAVEADDADIFKVREQTLREKRADESRRARHEHGLAF